MRAYQHSIHRSCHNSTQVVQQWSTGIDSQSKFVSANTNLLWELSDFLSTPPTGTPTKPYLSCLAGYDSVQKGRCLVFSIDPFSDDSMHHLIIVNILSVQQHGPQVQAIYSVIQHSSRGLQEEVWGFCCPNSDKRASLSQPRAQNLKSNCCNVQWYYCSK